MDDLEKRIEELEDALTQTQNWLRAMIIGQFGEGHDPWPENGPLEGREGEPVEDEEELDPVEAELRQMLSE